MSALSRLIRQARSTARDRRRRGICSPRSAESAAGPGGPRAVGQGPGAHLAQWDEAVPGFVEIDTVFHDGGSRGGGHAFTLTVTDIATGWTESRSMPDRAAKRVIAALNHIAAAIPFPILGVDCDNGSEFINDDLLTWCQDRNTTFTRSQPGNKNDGCHVEQKNWTVVRTLVGYYR